MKKIWIVLPLLALNEMAHAYLMKGALDNAEDVLKGTLEEFPKSAYVHLARGFIFLSKGFDAYAAESFAQAAQADPKDARIALGAVAMAARQWDEAEKEFRRALDLDPYHARAHYELGRALSAVKNPSSRASFREAARLEPAVYGFAAKQASR